MIHRLEEDAQTIHAETLGLLLAIEAGRSWSHLPGSFTEKIIKGRSYVYFQYSGPSGTKSQMAVGPKTTELERIISDYRERRAEHEPDLSQVERLAGLGRAAGLASTPHAPARILRALADAGVFRLGGMLVGSYAFQVIGNLLGVRWPAASWRTEDVDIASTLRVAIPDLEADIPKTLESLKMGFIPVPPFDPRDPSTAYRVRGKKLQVDLITPGSGTQERPVFIKRFKAAASPIKYLSLLMRDAQPAYCLGKTATLITVPSPARFALHKLLVSQTRSLIQQTKSGKDRHQAALVLEVLASDRPEEITEAAASFASSGPAVTKKMGRAFRAMVTDHPEVQSSEEFLAQALG